MKRSEGKRKQDDHHAADVEEGLMHPSHLDMFTPNMFIRHNVKDTWALHQDGHQNIGCACCDTAFNIV